MKIHKGTAAALVVLVLGIAALAAWGDQLGMSEGSLHWVQGAAGCVGALVMALLPKLFHDGNGDGIPDIVQRGSMLLVLALGAATVGCGAQLTASQREALAVETQRCAAREMEIANNPCGDLSPEQCRARDDADQAAEQTRCDAARAAIVGGAP